MLNLLYKRSGMQILKKDALYFPVYPVVVFFATCKKNSKDKTKWLFQLCREWKTAREARGLLLGAGGIMLMDERDEEGFVFSVKENDHKEY